MSAGTAALRFARRLRLASGPAAAALLMATLLLAGCGGPTFYADRQLDVDGDGFTPAEGDCDDRDLFVHPEHEEVCDGRDNDCDGLLDGLDPDLGDKDGDGSDVCVDCDDDDPAAFPGNAELCDGVDSDCDGGAGEDEVDEDDDGTLLCAGDCDDREASIHPGAAEVCDGEDSDCDGLDDDNDPDVPDEDNDGSRACSDCDDGDPTRFPDNPELCDGVDNNCNGSVPPGEVDEDGDGVLVCADDCDDDDATRFPDNPELCNGNDDDCSDLLPSPPDEVDGDGDGVRLCDSDCDDGDVHVFPGQTEFVCNGIDDDCSGALDPEEADVDGDGVALCDDDCDDDDAARFPGNVESCDGVDGDCDGVVPAEELDADGDGSAPCAGDCDDADPGRLPGAPETCDGVDEDCDGVVPPDEVDGDNDGFAPCEGDCDDNAAGRFPGQIELCNGVDDDCDTTVPSDELDTDNDGFVPCGGDCDDSNPGANPDAAEACNGFDDDCDGDADDEDDEFVDGDSDGFGPCLDCDDGDPDVAPDQAELCGNGVDDDCDGFVDEPDAALVDPVIATGRPDGAVDLWAVGVGGALSAAGTAGGGLGSGISLPAGQLDLDGDGVGEMLRQQYDAADEDNDTVDAIDFDCATAWGAGATIALDLPGDHRLIGGGQLSGDGVVDLISVAFTGVSAGEVRSYLGDGGATFSGVPAAGTISQATTHPRWAISPQADDLDGDGVSDLVACGWGPSQALSCSLLAGVGDGSFDAPVSLPVPDVPVDAVALGDLDGDGFVDLGLGLSDEGDPGSLLLLPGDGAGGLGSAVELVDLNPADELGDGPAAGRGSVRLADVDEDGDVDLVLLWDTGVQSADRALSVALGDGGGGFTLGPAIGASPPSPDISGPDWLSAPLPPSSSN